MGDENGGAVERNLDLTDLEEAILSLAATPPRQPGEMANRIRDLGLTQTEYDLTLAELLDTERALAAYPRTVNRLRDAIERRSRARSFRLPESVSGG